MHPECRGVEDVAVLLLSPGRLSDPPRAASPELPRLHGNTRPVRKGSAIGVSRYLSCLGLVVHAASGQV